MVDVPQVEQKPLGEMNVIDSNTSCSNCRFNLRGLSPDGNCPECGMAIAHSLGGALTLASREYILRLRHGAGLVALTPLAWIAAFAVTHIYRIVTGSQSIRWQGVFEVLSLVIFAFMVRGYWLLSSADAMERAGIENILRDPRPAMRGSVIVLIGAAAIFIVMPFFPDKDPGFEVIASASKIVAVVVIIVLYFASMTRVKQLAIAVPSDFFARQVNRYRWQLPIIVLIGAIVVAGGLIAVLIYVLIMNKLRIELNRVLDMQRQNSDGATGHPAG